MDMFKLSISASVLILAIVLIRALFLHKLPKRTFIVLWGIALCRLLIPFSIPSEFSIFSIADNMHVNSGLALNFLEMPLFQSTSTITTSLSDATATFSVEMIWRIGLFMMALFFISTHLRGRREYKTALPCNQNWVIAWQSEHQIKRKVLILYSDRINAPLTYGVLKPVILLPKTIDWTDEKRLLYILTHEFSHIQRFDVLKKWLLAVALCVHWFNPFVWVMYVLANRDIELSCDETVVRHFGESKKSAYALTLIGMEEKKSRLTPLVNSFSKNAIEERIYSIMKLKKTSLVGISLALVLIIGTAAFFATSSASTITQYEDLPKDYREKSTESSDTIIRYSLPGTPGNNSGYTADNYAALMALKIEDYRNIRTSDYLVFLKQNNFEMLYSGYNPNDANLDFLMTLQYAMSELTAEWESEYEQTEQTPYLSISTASNKKNAEGIYYGALLDFAVFWTGSEGLTVGERDDTLNETLNQIQKILEQKGENQIGNVENLKADFRALADQMTSEKIKVSIEINAYLKANYEDLKKIINEK